MWYKRYKLQELCVLWDSADSAGRLWRHNSTLAPGAHSCFLVSILCSWHISWSVDVDVIYLQINVRGKTLENHSQQKTLWNCESKRGLAPENKKILVKKKEKSSWVETTTLQDHVWPQARFLDQLVFKEVRPYHPDHNIANSMKVEYCPTV